MRFCVFPPCCPELTLFWPCHLNGMNDHSKGNKLTWFHLGSVLAPFFLQYFHGPFCSCSATSISSNQLSNFGANNFVGWLRIWMVMLSVATLSPRGFLSLGDNLFIISTADSAGFSTSASRNVECALRIPMSNGLEKMVTNYSFTKSYQRFITSFISYR